MTKEDEQIENWLHTPLMSKGFIVALVVIVLNMLIVMGATIYRGLKQHKVDLPLPFKRKRLDSFALSENSWYN